MALYCDIHYILATQMSIISLSQIQLITYDYWTVYG